MTKKKKIKLDQSSLRLVSRLARDSIRPYAAKIALSLLMMSLVAAATALSAWLMDPVVNKVFVEKRFDMLWPVGLAVLATAVVKGLASYGSSVH
ncbi:MAG: ABC transporter permease, partial [Rhodospirillales bacterium]